MKRSRLIVSLATITLCVAIAMVFTIRMFPLRGQDRAVHSISEPGVVSPRVLYKVEPHYTPDARDAKIAGTVMVELEVQADGRAHNAQIVRSLDPGLDQNAIDAIFALAIPARHEEWPTSHGARHHRNQFQVDIGPSIPGGGSSAEAPGAAGASSPRIDFR